MSGVDGRDRGFELLLVTAGMHRLVDTDQTSILAATTAGSIVRQTAAVGTAGFPKGRDIGLLRTRRAMEVKSSGGSTESFMLKPSQKIPF